MESVDAFDISVLIQGCEAGIGHADFFTHIDIRCASEHLDGSGQHLGTFFSVLLIITEA